MKEREGERERERERERGGYRNIGRVIYVVHNLCINTDLFVYRTNMANVSRTDILSCLSNDRDFSLQSTYIEIAIIYIIVEYANGSLDGDTWSCD